MNVVSGFRNQPGDAGFLNRTDGRINLLVYRREQDYAGNRLICKLPVFDNNASATDNSAIGGAAGSGGSVGLGEGGGLYLAAGGDVCLDAFTQAHVKNNHASTSDDDIFGDFTTC